MFTLAPFKKIESSLLLIVIFAFFIKLLCIGSNDLLVEEAYYWNYSAHLAMGYLDHPPMVALLIKLGTLIFGTNEFGVRIPALFCWLIAAGFSFKLSELIKSTSGKYSILLLSVLPFFFLHSLIITPDLPLIACWSATLYYLYRALILNHSTAWYAAGIWLGLGLLSKYTIVLLGLATFCYMAQPYSRQWFLRIEPYLCALIAAVLFTPVIYWNATHDWISFTFQSTRRLEETSSFTFHHLLGLWFIFLTPVGVLGFLNLFKTTSFGKHLIDTKSKRFIQIYTLTPLVVFACFSMNHEIKFNWIGPCLLSIIPWLALLMTPAQQVTVRKQWIITSVVLLMIYVGMLGCIIFSIPQTLNQRLFSKYIDWSNLTRQLYAVAQQVTSDMHASPIIIPMDTYNIASELTFYQAKFLTDKQIPIAYKVLGSHVFGHESLMYRYWSQGEKVADQLIILVDENPDKLEIPGVRENSVALSETNSIWAYSQGYPSPIRRYYYKVVQMKI